MKKILYLVLFVFVSGHLCQLGLPWWGIAPIGALGGWLFPQGAWRSLLGGFLGGLLLWLGSALWLDVANTGILSQKVGALFMGLSRWQVLLCTGLLGGILGGFGALTGHWGREAFQKSSQ